MKRRRAALASTVSLLNPDGLAAKACDWASFLSSVSPGVVDAAPKLALALGFDVEEPCSRSRA